MRRQARLDRYCPEAVIHVFQHGQSVPVKVKNFNKMRRRSR